MPRDAAAYDAAYLSFDFTDMLIIFAAATPCQRPRVAMLLLIRLLRRCRDYCRDATMLLMLMPCLYATYAAERATCRRLI